MMLILHWLAGLAGLLLILYKIKSYSLLWQSIGAWRKTARADMLYLLYSQTILLAGTAGNLLTAYCLLYLWWHGEVLGLLLAISAVVIIFAVLPEKVMKGLRALNDWYLKAKGINNGR